MDIGWIISLLVAGVIIIIILSVVISMERKFIIRENGKINYRKTTIFLRWNVFDTLTLILAIYTIICVQILNILVSSGKTIDSSYVQFFMNQSQVWTLVSIIYLIVRVSSTLKTIKERWHNEIE